MNYLQSLGMRMKRAVDDMVSRDIPPDLCKEIIEQGRDLIRDAHESRIQIVSALLCDDVVTHGVLRNHDDRQMVARTAHTIASELEELMRKDLENE